MPEHFPELFQPLTVGHRTLRNRFVNSGHGTNLGHGAYGERLLAYMAERARGGAALVISQANSVSPDYGDIKASDDSIVRQWRDLAERVHEHGALAVVQLQHPGSQGVWSGPGTGPMLSASAVPIRFLGGPLIVPRAMDEGQIRLAIRQFAEAAARAQAAGLDGVEVHCAHGNLVEQFLNPDLNRRDDDWGRSRAGRLRFAAEVLRAIRARVGNDFIVGARVTGGVPGDPLATQACHDRVEDLDGIGVADYLSVSVGHYASATGTAQNLPDASFPPAAWRDFGRAVKERTSTPVFLVGRITSAGLAASLVREGACDAVAMARPLAADPFLPTKAAAGAAARARPCVGIQDGCWGRAAQGLELRCAFNPEAGTESSLKDLRVEPAAGRTARIVVVGSGPAGLEAARQSAVLGHDVVLFERDAELGGLLPTIARTPHRGEIAGILRWFERELALLGVDVRTSVLADTKAVLSETPDHVVLATGATARPPRHLTGVVPTIDVRDAFGPVTPGSRVIIADAIGGRAALSAAEYLAANGARVTLTTEMNVIGSGVDETVRGRAHARLLAAGVRLRPSSLIRVHQGQLVETSVYADEEVSIEHLDLLVTAYPPEAFNPLEAALIEYGLSTVVVGDALTPRDITTATAEGSAAAWRVGTSVTKPALRA